MVLDRDYNEVIKQLNCKNVMVVELIIPIETMRGKLKNDGYYFRVCKGKQIVQHNPTQWKDTPARKAAREKFIEKYGRKKARN